MGENKKAEKKNSGKGLKIFLIILIIVIVIALVAALCIKFLGNKVETGEDIVSDIDQELVSKSNAAGNLADMNNVIVTSEGIKVNISDKMFEERTFGKFTVSNVSLSAQSGRTIITVTVKNGSSSPLTNKEFTLTLLNSKGKEIGKVTGIIDSLEVGSQTVVYINADSDLSNAYNYNVKF